MDGGEETLACVKDANGAVALLKKGSKLTVGRSATATLPVRDRFASRLHLTIISLQDRVWMVDTSRTGTVVRSKYPVEVVVKHGGVLVENDIDFFIGADAANKSQTRPMFLQLTGIKTRGEGILKSRWIPSFVHWSLLPPCIKEQLPPLDTPATAEEEWKESHSQAFSIFHLFSKKLPLPVQAIGRPNSEKPQGQKRDKSNRNPRKAKRRMVAKPKIVSSQDYDFDF